MPEKKTWVYLVAHKDDTLPVKIGLATNLYVRVASLQTGNPLPLVLVNKFPGGRDSERALHNALASLCVGREWFRRGDLVDEVFEDIRERLEDRCEFIDHLPMAEPEECTAAAKRALAYYEYGDRTGDWDLENRSALPPALLAELEAEDASCRRQTSDFDHATFWSEEWDSTLPLSS